jgi:hypothetical protein
MPDDPLSKNGHGMGTVEVYSNKSCSREGLQPVKSVKYSTNNSNGWITRVGEVIQSFFDIRFRFNLNNSEKPKTKNLAGSLPTPNPKSSTPLKKPGSTPTSLAQNA